MHCTPPTIEICRNACIFVFIRQLVYCSLLSVCLVATFIDERRKYCSLRMKTRKQGSSREFTAQSYKLMSDRLFFCHGYFCSNNVYGCVAQSLCKLSHEFFFLPRWEVWNSEMTCDERDEKREQEGIWCIKRWRERFIGNVFFFFAQTHRLSNGPNGLINGSGRFSSYYGNTFDFSYAVAKCRSAY